MSPATILREIADFCYPPVCAVCHESAERSPVCSTCQIRIESLEQHPYCPKCAMPLATTGAPCPHCLGGGIRPFGQILRLCSFEEPVRDLIHALKFRRAWGIGEFLADRLYLQPAIRQRLQGCDLLVPVPLHPLRQFHRGYNQAEVIARRLGKLAHCPVRKPALRLFHTGSQTVAQSRSQRQENLRHAFGLLNPKQVVGRRVVVVDDVRTTASTLQSFARCLKQGKPASLDAVVVAVADPRHSHFEKIG